MGDTGSLPLGGLIGYIAVVTRQEMMLLIAGGVFVMEAVSVMLQVGYFKFTGGEAGQRLFRCADPPPFPPGRLGRDQGGRPLLAGRSRLRGPRAGDAEITLMAGGYFDTKGTKNGHDTNGWRGEPRSGSPRRKCVDSASRVPLRRLRRSTPGAGPAAKREVSPGVCQPQRGARILPGA